MRKNCKPAYCGHAHKKNPTLIKVISDRFFEQWRIPFTIWRAQPLQIFCVGTPSPDRCGKIPNRLTVACASAQKVWAPGENLRLGGGSAPQKWFFDVFSYNDENTTWPSGPRSPCWFFCSFLAPPADSMRKKLQTGILWPCASAQKNPTFYLVIFDRFFVQYRIQFHHAGPRSSLWNFCAFLGTPPLNPWEQKANRHTVAPAPMHKKTPPL